MEFAESLEDTVIKEQESEQICDVCSREMTLNVKRKKRNRWDKGFAVYECVCGNKFRKRSVNEILRDLGEKQ